MHSLGQGSKAVTRQARLRGLLSQLVIGNIRALAISNYFKSFGKALSPMRETIAEKDPENPNASIASVAASVPQSASLKKSLNSKVATELTSQTVLASSPNFSNEPFIHPDTGLTSAASDTNEAMAMENNGPIFAATTDINISPSSMDNALQKSLRKSVDTLRSLLLPLPHHPINAGQR